MRRVLILTAVLCQSVFGYASYSGWCENGGVKVTVQGLSSPLTFQQSFPNLKLSADGPNVTVYATGTTDKATLYSDNDGTPLNNPFPCSSTGQYQFFSTNSVIDLLFSGSGISAFTRSAIAVTDGCPTNSTCDGSYKTLAAACTAAGTGTLYLTRTWSGLTTQTLACNIQALANGIIKPASGQAVSLTGFFDGTQNQHFDLSSGGTVSLSGAKTGLISVLWFGGSTPITSAISASGTNFVLIPSSYAGTDTYVAANKNVIDLRGNYLGIYQYISPSRPITGFPMGNDLVIDTEGPADLSLQHGNLCGGTGANKCPTTTTSTSISAGTQDITVASTLNFGCSSLQNPSYPITCNESLSAWIGIGTDTQEACLINSIKSLTVMNVTCLHSHSGTTDVQQASVTAMTGQTSIVLESVCPVNAVTHCPVTLGTNQGSIIRLPASASDSFPANTIRVFAPLTGAVEGGSHGEIPNPAVLTLQNAGSSFPVLFRDSSGNEIARFADTTTLLGENATSVKINDFTFNSAACSGTCTINPFKGISTTLGLGTLTTGSGTSSTVTITGLASGTQCIAFPANAAAATMVYTAPGIYNSGTTSNTATFVHGSGLAGAVFRVGCGSF